MGTSAKPIFKRVDHVSLTVDDIEAALSFYVNIMGCTLQYRMGPFDAAEIPAMSDGRDWTDAHVNVKGARLEIAMVQFAGGLGMELFQYDLPKDKNKTPPRNCDTGARHICIEVANVDTAISYLTEHNCQAMAGPILSEDGPCPPSKSWYILDPFGHQLELVEYI